MIDELLNKLRYKCEGADIDFKSAQYRFNKGTEDIKGEILKDILAIANAWRDGAGYILLGFKDKRPHPAEVVGINESIDDAQLQQFVNSKIKPKLTFSYEEHLYEGKTVALITIPKQKRPFYLTHAYGKLKSNVVYVRRGSSTDEAEPQEIHEMIKADSGQGDMRIELSVMTEHNEALPDSVELRFVRFSERFPDYQSPKPVDTGSLLSGLSFEMFPKYDNGDYWRELGRFISLTEGAFKLKFVLANRSSVQLSNAKLEAFVEPIDAKGYKIIPGLDFPEKPRRQWANSELIQRFPEVNSQKNCQPIIEHNDTVPFCSIRFGLLLPGEEARTTDTLAIVVLGPGKLRLRFRVLASELAKPYEIEREIECTGPVESYDFKRFKSQFS